MGVESGRIALAAAPEGYGPRVVAFATTAPAYADKTNATAIHAALGLARRRAGVRRRRARSARGVGAVVMAAGAGRSRRPLRHAHRSAGFGRRGRRRRRRRRVGVRRRGRHRRGRRVGVGERRVHRPLARARASRTRNRGRSASASTPTCRWPRRPSGRAEGRRHRPRRHRPRHRHRLPRPRREGGRQGHRRPTDGARRRPLDRDRQHRHGPLGAPARRRPRPRRARVRRSPSCCWPTAATCGSCARPTPWSAHRPARVGPRSASRATRDDLTYPQFLTWRGFLDREPPRRPEPDRPAAPPSLRTDAWKYGFVGSRDEDGFVHLPPSRVSHGLRRDRPDGGGAAWPTCRATIATFTVDRLAFSLSPPVVAAIIDFDGGGRFQCELTDVDPASVKIGDRVEMTFRRLYTQRRRAQLLLEGAAAWRRRRTEA